MTSLWPLDPVVGMVSNNFLFKSLLLSVTFTNADFLCLLVKSGFKSKMLPGQYFCFLNKKCQDHMSENPLSSDYDLS